MFHGIDKRTLFIRRADPADKAEKHADQFDRIVIKPLKVIGFVNGEEVDCPCSPELAAYWRVYGRYGNNSAHAGLEELKDFPTETAARQYSDQLCSKHRHLRCRPRLSLHRVLYPA